MKLWKIVGNIFFGIMVVVLLLSFTLSIKMGDNDTVKAERQTEEVQKTMLTYQLEGNKEKSKILKEYKEGTSEDKEALFNRYAKVFRKEDKGTILEDYVRGSKQSDGLYVYYEGLSAEYAKDFVNKLEDYKANKKAYPIYIFYGPLEQESGIYFYEYGDSWESKERPEVYVVNDTKVIWEGPLTDELPLNRN